MHGKSLQLISIHFASSCVKEHKSDRCLEFHAKDFVINRMTSQQPKAFGMSHSNQWSTGICDCCQDVPECCYSFWCFPCFACTTSRKHGECLCLPLLDLCGFVPPMSLAMRVSVRKHYGIQGSICNDCMYSTFCCVCSWCQISREMNVRG